MEVLKAQFLRKSGSLVERMLRLEESGKQLGALDPGHTMQCPLGDDVSGAHSLPQAWSESGELYRVLD